MGDSRPKKSPDPDPAPVVERHLDQKWRDVVRKALADNKKANRAAGLNRHDPDRLIDDYARLAHAVNEYGGFETDKTQMANILGQVRKQSDPAGLVDRSKFVDAICAVLCIPLPDQYADELALKLKRLDPLEYQTFVDLVDSPERRAILAEVMKRVGKPKR